MMVNKKLAEDTITRLRSMDIIDNNYLIQHDQNYVYIPVIEKIEGHNYVDMNGIQKEIKNEKISFSYDIIGDIAIIKGKSEEEAKILSKYLIERKNIKTIYLDNGITGEFRTRTLKLLYGESKTTTLYRENSINLLVDVQKAYFSPRLSTERLRISNEVKEHEYIIDMFCGIGPFSVLIAHKTDSSIVSMDKNCDAIGILGENMKINRLKGNITPVCGDSAELVKNYRNVDRIIMNLPHGAYNFLDIAFKALKKGGVINYYEICDYETLENRMIFFRNSGFEILYKRIVHGFSRNMNMYSIEIKKL